MILYGYHLEIPSSLLEPTCESPLFQNIDDLSTDQKSHRTQYCKTLAIVDGDLCIDVVSFAV